jgi:hypothetical protein
MSEYTHRVTLAVPEALMAEANQLALMAGESSDDDKTFTIANWTDGADNLYSVCSTISKPVVLELLTKGLPDKQESDADYDMAKAALSKIIVLRDGVKASVKHIVLAINAEPLKALKQMGLTVQPNQI